MYVLEIPQTQVQNSNQTHQASTCPHWEIQIHHLIRHPRITQLLISQIEGQRERATDCRKINRPVVS
jgi:hypothetical protein